jgi:hypothetical protein
LKTQGLDGYEAISCLQSCNENVRAIYKIDEKDKLKITAVINEPVQAPVKKGTEVGYLKIRMGEFPERRVKVVCGRGYCASGCSATHDRARETDGWRR